MSEGSPKLRSGSLSKGSSYSYRPPPKSKDPRRASSHDTRATLSPLSTEKSTKDVRRASDTRLSLVEERAAKPPTPPQTRPRDRSASLDKKPTPPHTRPLRDRSASLDKKPRTLANRRTSASSPRYIRTSQSYEYDPQAVSEAKRDSPGIGGPGMFRVSIDTLDQASSMGSEHDWGGSSGSLDAIADLEHSMAQLISQNQLTLQQVADLQQSLHAVVGAKDDVTDDVNINLKRLGEEIASMVANKIVSSAIQNGSPNLRRGSLEIAKCEPLSMVAFKDPELDALREENARLQGALEERRGQARTLQSEVDKLRNTLNKNERDHTEQQKRLERLETQILHIEISRKIEPHLDQGRLSDCKQLTEKRASFSFKPCPYKENRTYDNENKLYIEKRDTRTVHQPTNLNDDLAVQRYETSQFGPHKVILVGDSGVGKSSFMLRLCEDCFNDKMNPSFGLDFKTKIINVDGQEENVQIWDTAGQERFRSITQSYFRKVDGIILVYDITHEESFLHLQNWVSCIQEAGQLSAPMFIVGNKLDLEHLRCVTQDMVKELADFYESDYIEVSAKDGVNISAVGEGLVRKLVERRDMQIHVPHDKSYTLTNSATETETTTCCVIL